jgi:hypothetical protein
MTVPTPEDVRAALAGFDTRQQKIVAGLLTVMMKNPDQVRDREWIARQLTELTLLAGDFDADSPNEGVQAIQDFLQQHSEEILRATFLLFQRVGLDMEPRVEEGFTFEEALQCGLGYMTGE